MLLCCALGVVVLLRCVPRTHGHSHTVEGTTKDWKRHWCPTKPMSKQQPYLASKLLRGVTCENQTLQYSPVLFITFTYIFQSCLGAARGSHTKLNCIAGCLSARGNLLSHCLAWWLAMCASKLPASTTSSQSLVHWKDETSGKGSCFYPCSYSMLLLISSFRRTCTLTNKAAWQAS
jgi:hypothetical protein